MSERQLQFRVGIFVALSLAVGTILIFQFSEWKDLWRQKYPLAVHFEEIPGLHLGSPVKQNGITIGAVKEIMLDDEAGGVLVILDIYGDHQLRSDVEPRVTRSLFGDSKIEFSAGRSQQYIPPRSRLEGVAATDPMKAIERLEHSVSTTLTSFDATSREWQQVARNINGLLDTNRGHLDDVIERSAVALDTFNETMQAATVTFSEAGETLKVASSTLASANQLMADPELQANLRKTAAELPRIAEETRRTITFARASIEQVTKNLTTLQSATEPLARESDVIARKLSGSLIQLESLLTELNQFSHVVNSSDGSFKKFASDPSLYQNLNRSAAALAVLLDNVSPAIRDFGIFADRVARHPEVLGISGAVRPSTGLKESSEVQQTGYSTPTR